jgi:poly(A) polymerase
MAVIALPEREGLVAVADLIGAREGQARLVGGAVRDTLAGLAVHDIDLATSLAPQEVMRRIEKAGIRVVPTGLAHGTVTAVLPSGPIEITTLRRDVSTDGRRATVAFTDDWKEDAARRDFTINALYADPHSGEVFDYFGGQQDLAAGVVRFIGEPLQRIAEDHLRILRFFRFHARFGRDGPHEESFAACRTRANDLMALSRERIADELLKLLALPRPAATIGLMIGAGILAPVLPEADKTDTLLALEPAGAGDGILRLAALLPAKPDLAEAVGYRLKLSKAQIRRLAIAAGRVPGDAQAPQTLAYRIGVEGARDRLLLQGFGTEAALLADWVPPVFPLSGGAIVARGVNAGPLVARILKSVEEAWLAEGFPGAERVDELADQITREIEAGKG